jgi:hypothetical protein
MYHLSERVRDQLMMRSTECLDDRSHFHEKIEFARYLFAAAEDALKGNRSIYNLLRKLEASIDTSRQTMMDLNIVETCRRCDEEEGGSCCGAGLENKFDAYLLLMNLLLGVSLPTFRQRPDSCFLLADTGCMLKVRLVLCVDFLCPKILEALTGDDLIRLQTVSGDELVTGFKVYDAIKRFFRHRYEGEGLP